MYLSNSTELTDQEALAIIEKEIKKLTTQDLILIGTGDYRPLREVVKNSVKQICVKGATKQATNYLPYIAVGGSLLLLFLLLK